MRIFGLRVEDFDNVIELGNRVFGDDYIPLEGLAEELEQSTKGGINCSFVAYDDITEKLVGFRTTLAPGQWDIDETCSVDKWGVPPDKVCYFQSIVVDPDYRRQGIARSLMEKSMEAAKLQGAVAGLAHNWSGSPDNGAYEYIIKCGGEVVACHSKLWEGMVCVRCGEYCTCTGRETILRFDEE
jgi:ribosomal protein S18 acetylase RimI-like enzyme